MNTLEHYLKDPSINIEERENCLLVNKWEWDYADCLDFQLAAVEFVKSNPQKSIYISTSHPNVFTYGRGLQKGKDEKLKQLQDFDPRTKTKFPLHMIKRGGGLTFHSPQQYIFYPIIKLSPKKSLSGLIDLLMDSSVSTLETAFSVESVEKRRDLLGLWVKDKKLASFGIALDRYVTYHGMALNLDFNQEMLSELQKLNPCGLSGNIYTSLSQLVPDEFDKLRQKFHDQFRDKFLSIG